MFFSRLNAFALQMIFKLAYALQELVVAFTANQIFIPTGGIVDLPTVVATEKQVEWKIATPSQIGSLTDFNRPT